MVFLTTARYFSVVERRLWPTSLEMRVKGVPAWSWWAIKVCLRSLILAPLMSASLKYLSMAVRMFLTRKGRPFLVTKIFLVLVLGLILR